MDSLTRAMEQNIGQLTDADRRVIEYQRAEARGNYVAALRAALRQVPYSPVANFGVGAQAVAANYPAEAKRALESFDPDQGWVREFIGYDYYRVQAFHQLGEYEAELRAGARRGWNLFPWIALGQLDSVRAWSRNSRGYNALRGALELRVHGHADESVRLLQHVVDRYATRDRDANPTERMSVAIAMSLLGLHDAATDLVTDLVGSDTLRLDYRGLLGVVSAHQGDDRAAREVSAELEAVDEPYLFGLPTLWRARIAATLEERDEAVRLLERAFAEGTRHEAMFPLRAAYWHSDPWFEPLHGYRPFQDLVRPKTLPQ